MFASIQTFQLSRKTIENEQEFLNTWNCWYLEQRTYISRKIVGRLYKKGDGTFASHILWPDQEGWKQAEQKTRNMSSYEMLMNFATLIEVTGWELVSDMEGTKSFLSGDGMDLIYLWTDNGNRWVKWT